MSPPIQAIPTIADAISIDALLVGKMRAALASMLRLNVRGFRTAYKGSYYNSTEVLKQSLELLFEFGVSTKSYREAIRTIQVYSQGDEEAEKELRRAFSIFSNAAHAGYAGMKYVDEISPRLLFLEGIHPDESEFQRALRSVGVKPPALIPPSAQRVIFLDEEFEPYKLALNNQSSLEAHQDARMRLWTNKISTTLKTNVEDVPVLLRVAAQHLGSKSFLDGLGFRRQNRLSKLLMDAGFQPNVIFRGVLLENVFGS